MIQEVPYEIEKECQNEALPRHFFSAMSTALAAGAIVFPAEPVPLAALSFFANAVLTKKTGDAIYARCVNKRVAESNRK